MQSHHPPVLKLVRFAAPLVALVCLCLQLAGCGQTGAPQPPSLNLPEPVTDLTASRIGNSVTLKWTMPRRTTDKLLLKGPQPVHVCRKIGDGPCQSVADVSFPPEKPATYDDKLPANLTNSEPQLLTYLIDVNSRHGRSAGDSNPAYTASGAAPAPITGFHGAIQADGVLLQWQSVALTGEDQKISIHRNLLSVPDTAKPENKSPFGSSPTLVKEQTLVVRMPSGRDTGKALDSDAAFDQRYSYRISRISTASLGGKSVTVEGDPSSEIVVGTKDIFPPRPPSGLAGIAVPEESAIDLSWVPDTESDLAGYAVYRSEGGQPAQRISGQKPLDAPAFHDSALQPGRAYTYFVTAIDRDGNESGHSTETTETLPPKQ